MWHKPTRLDSAGSGFPDEGRVKYPDWVRQVRRGADRTRYTMSITGNTININVDAVSYQGVETSPHWGFFMKYEKTHTPLQKGKFVVYLNEKLVDLSKEVVVIVNNKEVFKGIPQADVQHIVNSCATFFDPERLFPVAVEVSL